MCVVTSASGLVPAAARPSLAFISTRCQKPEQRCEYQHDQRNDNDRRESTAPPRLELVVGRERAEHIRRRFGDRRFVPVGRRRLRRLRCSRIGRVAAVGGRLVGRGWRFRFAIHHRFFVSPLFGLGPAARLDQRRLAQALLVMRRRIGFFRGWRVQRSLRFGGRLSFGVGRRDSPGSGSWCQLCLHAAQRTCRPSGGIAPSFTTYCVPQSGQVRIISAKALFRDGERTVNRNE